MRIKGGENMRVNVDALKGKIVDRGLTQEQVAEKINLDRSTFSRKMCSNALKFSVGDMHKLCDVLQLSAEEAKHIFLAS